MNPAQPQRTHSDASRDLVSRQPRPAGLLAPVRIVVWDESDGALAVRDIAPAPDESIEAFIEQLVRTTDGLIREQGATMPVAALREVIANLAHAHFAAASICIMARGNTVVVADRGPGIADPERAMCPGHSTAGPRHREHMRGTGMGLPVARAAMEGVGGRLQVERNLSHGTVVRLGLSPEPSAEAGATPGRARLSDREKRVLSLLGDLGAAGPSGIARDLGIPLSTAHRLLTRLEDAGLVCRDSKGKRCLSQKGIQQVGLIFTE